MSQQPRLISKIFITGAILTETGLHIGGSKDGLDIGGVDLSVIKTHDGRPFIPGSSLKGKLRSLLARIEGSQKVARNKKSKEDAAIKTTDEDVKYLRTIFGLAGDEDDTNQELTRLIVRDAMLNLASSPNQSEYDDMDFAYTDVKFENTINRKKGVAEHPRQLERVPDQAHFDFELVLNVYDIDQEEYIVEKENEKLQPAVEGTSARDHYLYAISVAMRLLEDDYLGGQGSRGYGKIKFKNVAVKQKGLENYRYVEVANDEALNEFAAEFAPTEAEA